MEFIDNWFPLIVAVREGALDEPELEQLTAAFERYFRRAEHYAVLNVAKLGAGAPDARARLRIAQWGNAPRVRQFSKLLCAGTATVVTFPWERRALTALSWLWTPASPHQVVSTVNDGLDYCISHLTERGVELPRERETFRIDVQRMLRGLPLAGLPPRRSQPAFDWVTQPSARTDAIWRPGNNAPAAAQRARLQQTTALLRAAKQRAAQRGTRSS
ncbi:MAG: hypothetical protein RL685_6288 [Pseudomonadota bacterium]|jgi:hypothetical protein